MVFSQCHPESAHYGRGLCQLCWRRAYTKQRRKDFAAAAKRRYHQLTKEGKAIFKRRVWAAQIKRLYGITVEEYHTLYRTQQGRCALCTKQPLSNRLAIDHDHRTNKVRGLLCMPCNTVLGYFENLIWKRRAQQYLKSHKS